MEVEMEVVQSNHPVKIEPIDPVKVEIKEELEDIFADEPFTPSVDTLQSNDAVIVQENDEEIDILGMSDNEESANSNSTTGQNVNKNRVSFAHPATVSISSSSTRPPPTRVSIPEMVVQKRIMKKPARTKYVKDANKKDMAFNTQDYNYMDDELFFKKEDIPLPFEDMRMYEQDLEQRPPGEQRYIVDAIANAFNILQQEARRIQGQLRALNARSGRIRKQIDREEEAIARGEDPTEVPRSSKGLLEGELMIPVQKVPVKPPPPRPQSNIRPQSSIQKRKKKKIIRRKPHAANRSGNETTASTLKLAGTSKVETNEGGYE